MNELDKAIKLLKDGDVVALPTETVYGLAGSIDSEKALRKIFAVKERPFFDPLIVHVSNTQTAKNLAVSWDQTCDVLAKEFWPGPLTMVVKKNETVKDVITAGLDSVGLRCPDHPATLDIIERLGSPVAAPSANKFKRTSPTKKEHVLKEFGEEVFVVEGGESRVGIESTVVGVFSDKVEIYRPGMITSEDITKALNQHGISLPVNVVQSPVAPGQLKHHYMPKIPIVLSWDNQSPKLDSLNIDTSDLAQWHLTSEPTQAARKLYNFFRESEQEGKTAILISLKSSMKESPQWAGILNRLEKAKSFEIHS
ncbi:MAG: threonylcarbamoyl-AMP synthase [Halobacteriovoraceae bacterium]|nr:threonylcarbamoyl-AMP synthase [Halobacteriovoraceae bacterium]|tara:strand:+ start:11284 stop:12213 length:930 start_codon:yes stop_codon:yes gene_type:complete